MTLSFACHRSVLSPLVEAARKAVKRSPIPVLANLLVTAEEDGRLSVMGTDLSLAITTSASGVEVERAGTVSVEAAVFEASVKRMPDGIVRIADDGQVMTVKGGRASARIHTLPGADHPLIESGEAPCIFELSSSDLGRMADRCAHAMSTDEVRYYLAGIHWHVVTSGKDPSLVSVATDGTLLSKLAIDLPEGAADMPPVIVPAAMVRGWGGLVGRKDAPVQVALTDSHLTLSTPDLSITSRLVDGTFPDYDRVIPRDNPERAKVNAGAFAEALERMLVYAPDQENTHRLVKCAFADGALKLSTRSDRGEANDEIEVEGEADIIIGWNARRLLDAVKAVGGVTATLAMSDATAPTFIFSEDDPRHEAVIMPVRLMW